MQQQVSLHLLPHEAKDNKIIYQHIAQLTGKNTSEISGFYRVKESIDARNKQVYFNLTLHVFISEPFYPRTIQQIVFEDVSQAKHQVIIIGAGPAGLFAALRLIECGIKPIILERGKDVRRRRRDIAILNKEGIVNSESNYCFGEGGAGTYSDGKLYTRSTKRGDINRILNLFVQFGADKHILYESHPHIGTNKLPDIITSIREQISACGGDFLFEKKVVDFIIEKSKISTVITADGHEYNGEDIILATGHSARDIFELLCRKNILIEPKPFALGVRIEHPQELIDSVQYHNRIRNENLPPSSYSIVEQVNGRGVFSFCMCPGGIIAPAATNDRELVVNGWSPSKRNNPYGNSGMVVQVEVNDAIKYFKETFNESIETSANDSLILMKFQQIIEKRSFEDGGGNFVAPAQRMVDFCNNKVSDSLPECSYIPGVKSTTLNNVLPVFIYKSLQEGFKNFSKKRKEFYTNEAIVVATESRTSSPVRIPRDINTLNHPQIKNLFPCGEGAGYAGGIVSAAMDGERIADRLIKIFGD